MSLRVIIAVLLTLATMTGCEKNVDPTDPEGAYNLYIDALFTGDAETVWNRAAPSTHEYFQEQFDVLVQMDETIRRYLPPTDHKIAREQAGSILTNSATDGKTLFLQVFKPDTLALKEKHRVGSVVDQIRVNEEGTIAELKTLGGDVIYLTKGDKEQWFVMLVRSSSAVTDQMKWLGENESALKQTIEDLIAEERTKREAVIAELMRLQAPAGDKPAEKETGEAPTDEAAAANPDEGQGAAGDGEAGQEGAPTEDG